MYVHIVTATMASHTAEFSAVPSAAHRVLKLDIYHPIICRLLTNQGRDKKWPVRVRVGSEEKAVTDTNCFAPQ